MRPFPGLVWGCALAALVAGGGTAQAAWNNVFQVCCNTCRPPAAPPVTVAGYGGDPCPQPCPPQTRCSTNYVQRSYYQPVTTYRTSSYLEPVTTYKTSYYYEPVTSYRYSCYYDPCTCSYQQVAQPCTSYRLRSRCCPVTSYLQRTCTTPVTSYQQMFYYEPVTTCCTTTPGAPVTSLPPGATTVPPGASSVPVPPGPADPGSSAPTTDESRTPGTPESRKREHDSRYPSIMPPATDSSFRQPPAQPGRPVTPTPVTPPLRTRADRIASLSRYSLEGQVVASDRTPRSGAKLLLVHADKAGQRQEVTADPEGQFRANLEAGGWLVYVHNAAGRPVFSRRVEVQEHRTRQVTLVER